MTAVRWLVTLLVAALLWAALGFLATAPLGWAFGWSGHPSLPAAPTWVYVTTYLVVLPAISVGIAFGVISWLFKGRRR
jgi:hypothetical protein